MTTYTSLAQLDLSGTVSCYQILSAMPTYSQLTIASNAISDGPNDTYANGTWAYVFKKYGSVYMAATAQLVDASEAIVEQRMGWLWTSLDETMHWGGPIATATTPTEYDLELAEGITGTAKYCKTQDGVVHIRGWLSGVAQPVDDTVTIGYLPSGYRPAGTQNIIAAVSATTSDRSVVPLARIIVNASTGEISASQANSERVPNGISIDACFLASS